MSIQIGTAVHSTTAATAASTPPASVTGQRQTDTATRCSSAGTATDTVSISAAARAAAAEEARETPAQTAIEARNGDRQAQRLLAQREAAHPATPPVQPK